MFVPSLSWQNDAFLYINGSKTPFSAGCLRLMLGSDGRAAELLEVAASGLAKVRHLFHTLPCRAYVCVRACVRVQQAARSVWSAWFRADCDCARGARACVCVRARAGQEHAPAKAAVVTESWQQGVDFF